MHHKVLADKRFNDAINWETFPAFSPDGKWLYFCTAKAKLMPIKFNELHYSLIRVPFNEKDGSLGAKIDTIYSAAKEGGSISLPRISPDGRYVLLTWAGCSTFHIQHKDADLMLIDLKTRQIIHPKNVNSNDADSYHSWSQNGKWIIFASRRLDGMYSRLYIAPFKNGNFGKPFLLPQKDPQENKRRLYSYNIPEFIRAKVVLSKDKASALFKVN
jgi:dipeptidyl aminopeptidase/acylaminoacyl peptidase